jgi:ankyrin repeat protein
MQKIYRTLLQYGANPAARDEMGHEPLHCAAAAGQLDFRETLLERPSVNVNTLDHELRTPLICAAEARHLRLVQRIVFEHRPDVGWRDIFGHDAFMAACLGGHVQIVVLLFDGPLFAEENGVSMM